MLRVRLADGFVDHGLDCEVGLGQEVGRRGLGLDRRKRFKPLRLTSLDHISALSTGDGQDEACLIRSGKITLRPRSRAN